MSVSCAGGAKMMMVLRMLNVMTITTGWTAMTSDCDADGELFGGGAWC